VSEILGGQLDRDLGVDVIGQHLDDVVCALHVIKDRRGTTGGQ
jgi:hypothetical protein